MSDSCTPLMGRVTTMAASHSLSTVLSIMSSMPYFVSPMPTVSTRWTRPMSTKKGQ